MKLRVVQPTDRDQPWYADGLRFTCTQCGNCCTGGPGYVWISREEIVRLAEFLHLTPEETVEQYCRKINGRFSLNEFENARGEFDCVFLKEIPAERAGGSKGGGEKVAQTRRGCSIYPVRPLQCRTWPFWDGLLQSRARWDAAAVRCHGMNRGKAYPQARIEELRDAKDWPDQPPSSR